MENQLAAALIKPPQPIEQPDIAKMLSTVAQLETSRAHNQLYSLQAAKQAREFAALDYWKANPDDEMGFLTRGGDPAHINALKAWRTPVPIGSGIMGPAYGLPGKTGVFDPETGAFSPAGAGAGPTTATAPELPAKPADDAVAVPGWKPTAPPDLPPPTTTPTGGFTPTVKPVKPPEYSGPGALAPGVRPITVSADNSRPEAPAPPAPVDRRVPSNLRDLINTARPPGMKSDEHDEMFLSQVRAMNPSFAQDLERIAAGEGEFPKSTKPGYGLLLRMALARYGRIDETTFPVRQKTAKSWAPDGVVGKQAASYDVAMQHVADLGVLMHGLNESEWRIVNSATNWLKTEQSDPRLEAARKQAVFVATEVPKILKGPGVLTEEEFKTWNKEVAGSPNIKAFLGSLPVIAEGMRKRMNTATHQYTSIMHKPPPYGMSPGAVEAEKLINGWGETYGVKPEGVIIGHNPSTGDVVKKMPDGKIVIEANPGKK